jgi:8-oxo-dGTP diphosphatase
MPHQRVVPAVIQRDGRYLLCKRPAGKRYGGLWEFPGGKVAENETTFQAVERELLEQLDLTAVRVGEAEFTHLDPESGFLIEFVRTQVEGDPVLSEHEAMTWIEGQELLDLPLAPSDEEYVRFTRRVTPVPPKGGK